MSCYNVCKECERNDNDYCMAFHKSIDYLSDTSECVRFEKKSEEDEVCVGDIMECDMESDGVIEERSSSEESPLIIFAKQEFARAGYKSVEEEEGPNKWIQENVLELLRVFSAQGHSGFSASFCIDYFSRLASYKPLTALTEKDFADENWLEVGKGIYQHKIVTGVFKNGKKGKPYYIDAVIFREKGSSSFTGRIRIIGGETICSSQYIKLPFYPKSFYIDVTIANDDKYVLLKPSQLDEVFEYYERGMEQGE